MIIVAYPVMVVALGPIILIEAHCVANDLALAKSRALRIMALANLITTIAGVPLAWFAMLLIQMFASPVARAMGHELGHADVATAVFGAAWLPDAIPPPMVAVALCVLLVPCFFLSWYVEARLMWRFFLHPDEKQRLSVPVVSRAALRANFTSYGLLAVAVFGLSVLVR